MSDFRKVAAARQRWIDGGKRGALAHLVAVEGSHFRRPGARMLLAEDGDSFGSISGGCLDADLRRRIPDVIASGAAALVEYDTGSPEDVVFGLGLGCGGKIAVLLSPLVPRETAADPVAAAAADKRPSVIATVRRSAVPGSRLGDEVRLDADGRIVAGSGCSAGFVEEIRPILAEALREERDSAFRAGLPGVELLVERVPEPVMIVLAGSGEEIVALGRIAAGLGWETGIALSRVPAGAPARLAPLGAVPVRSPGEWTSLVSRRSAIVIATHHYLDDLEVLRAALGTPAAYVGVLGSRGRVARLSADAADVGDPARIHGPAGLDVGAETPEEIALSIAAEIQAVLAGRPGGPLCSSEGTLHRRGVEEPAPACAIEASR